MPNFPLIKAVEIENMANRFTATTDVYVRLDRNTLHACRGPALARTLNALMDYIKNNSENYEEINENYFNEVWSIHENGFTVSSHDFTQLFREIGMGVATNAVMYQIMEDDMMIPRGNHTEEDEEEDEDEEDDDEEDDDQFTRLLLENLRLENLDYNVADIVVRLVHDN